MNKAALKKFAVFARNELITQVKLKAKTFGVTPEGLPEVKEGADYIEVNNVRYDQKEKKAFTKLFQAYRQKGYEQLIEEVAYTWFNRFIAIRYMEIHNYLPSRIRVLSSATKGKVDPDILTDYHRSGLPVDVEEIDQLLQAGDREGAYRKLLIAQCNELSDILPFLFEKIDDYTALLLPDKLLHTDSVINVMNRELSEEDFAHVEVIGWLYQYYNTEKKEKIGGLKNTSVKKEDLPVVTQLFTPKWIVQYMVQNSLGKLYDELVPGNPLSKDWEYYLKSGETKDPVPENLTLEKIKIFDPACGSGHILVYAFDLLYEMYKEAGYPEKDIPRMIIENNLYGADIDKRSYQLANLALLMKAQEKDKRFLRREKNLKTHVIEIVDSESISDEALSFFTENEREKEEINYVLQLFDNGKQYGSLIVPDSSIPYDRYIDRLEQLKENVSIYDLEKQAYIKELYAKLLPVLRQGKLLSTKYHVVVTNPPYHNKYNPDLKRFMERHYKDFKADLYSAFIYRCTQMTVKNGYSALMTPFTWMFISTHQKLREYIIDNQSISSLIQLEYSAFKDATVPLCTFVIQNQDEKSVGEYVRLSDFKGDQAEKVREAVRKKVSYRYRFDSKNFRDIPGSPIAYWASDQVRKAFRENQKLGEIAEPRQGLATADNNRFLRLWYEVEHDRIGYGCQNAEQALNSKKKWFPYNKGGAFRKWYGNQEYVVNWENDGEEIKSFLRAVVRNPGYYFREGITWSFVSSSKFGVRYSPKGFIFDVGGSSLFPEKGEIYTLLSFLCSKLAFNFLSHVNPTLNFQVGNIATLPVVNITNEKQYIEDLSKQCISISKTDWDSFETSWDFKKHPFLTYRNGAKNLAESFANWAEHAERQFNQLKANEEELNRIFIELYGLQDEMTPDVPDEEVTVRKADRERDAKSFLSYCVGLIMGRYSLDVDGLAYAGGEWDPSKYRTIIPDQDGIVPLTDVAYFEDDIITWLNRILTAIYGKEELANNLQWLAESLGGIRSDESVEDRIRRYFFDEFYKDHCRIYQKRPIYWMADSGPKKGMRALFYLHRYTPHTLGTLRFRYVQELQVKLRQEEKYIEQRLADPSISAGERRALNKKLTTLRERQEELVRFDQKLAELANRQIALDLDDGVVVNYEKLKDVLAKIR